MTARHRHEGADPGDPGAAPSSYGTLVEQRVSCCCGRWTWHDIHVSIGLSAVERYCQRCKGRRLVVMQQGAVMGVVPLESRTVREFRRSLGTLDLPKQDVEELVRCLVIAANPAA